MRRWICLLFAGTMLAGCDTAIDPMLTVDGEAFAVHGYMDASVDTQFVRVEALRPVALGPSPSLEGVVVRSIDIERSETVVWSDSVVTDASGRPVHLFHAAFRGRPGARYRLEVARGTDQGAVAESGIPHEPEMSVFEPEGSSSFYVQTVSLRQPTAVPGRVAVVYYLDLGGNEGPRRISIDYGGAPARQGGAFPVSIFYSRDRETLYAQLGIDPDAQQLRLVAVAVETVMMSPEWTSTAADPGIQRGRGFFGGRAVFESSWRLTPEQVTEAGFVDAQPPG